MPITSNEIKKLSVDFPDSTFALDTHDPSLLHIYLKVNHIYNDFCVNEFFEIDVRIPLGYPYEIPDVMEVGNKIDSKYEHRYTNGQLCLGTNSEIMLNCCGTITMTYLINAYIIPYLFSYRYYERYKEYPFGDRSHGATGIVEAWMEAFGAKSSNEAYGIIKYAVIHPYRGHLPCPCNSGKKTRDCHPVSAKLLEKLNNKSIKKILLKDLKIFQDEVSYYERNRRKAK